MFGRYLPQFDPAKFGFADSSPERFAVGRFAEPSFAAEPRADERILCELTAGAHFAECVLRCQLAPSNREKGETMDWLDKWLEMVEAEEEAAEQAERELIRYWAMCYFEANSDDGICTSDYLEWFYLEYGSTVANLVHDEINRINRNQGEYLRYRFPSLSEVERMKRVANIW